MLPAQLACPKPPKVKPRLLWPITTVWVCASQPPWKVFWLLSVQWLPSAEGYSVQSVVES